MFTERPHHRLAILAGSTLLVPVALAAAAVAPTAASASPLIGFTAAAYGTSATVGAAGVTVGSAPSAPASFGFTTTPATAANSAAAVTIPALGTTVAAITDTVSSTFGATADSATAQSATVGPVSLLNGLIKASAVHVSATSTFNVSAGTFSGSATTTLAGLTIAGRSITATPSANSSIALPGIGVVYLNRQVKTPTSNGLDVQADGILVQVNVANSLGIPIGSTIIVGSADASGAGPLAGTLNGDAYGTSLTGGAVSSGPTFEQIMPGQGTDGKTLTSSGVGAADPLGLLSAGAISDSVNGTDNLTRVNASTSARVANASVLHLLTVNAVSASASAGPGTGGRPQLAGVVTLTNLVVNGVGSLPVSPPANYTVALPGGGSLILNYQVRTATGITVQALRLTLPAVGTLVIASATAGYGS